MTITLKSYRIILDQCHCSQCQGKYYTYMLTNNNKLIDEWGGFTSEEAAIQDALGRVQLSINEGMQYDNDHISRKDVTSNEIQQQYAVNC